MSASATRRDLLVAALLVVATLAVYGQVGGHDFIHYDDQDYVSENPRILSGLSVENLRWALVSVHSGNWHPLTTLSHMLDCELFGANPGPMHLVNVLLHAINSVLLYLLLRRSTRTTWPAALVAALFALHPLHVESVAWISERKDVLSTLFWLLTMLAYVGYTRKPGAVRFATVVGLFALGLLSKPMLVTLPCVLLLWDVWPLERWRFGKPLSAAVELVVEKLPLLLLSATAGWITLRVQSGADEVASLDVIPAAARVANALSAYVAYLVDTVWPAGLALIYPLAGSGGPLAVLGTGLLLAVISIAALALRHDRPWLLVGWLWYLGTLVPVIGLVQVGSQARADRYTYVPLIGIFLVVAWAAAELVQRRPRARTPVVLASGLIVVLLSLGSALQAARWRDSFTLFEHGLGVTGENPLLRFALGTALAQSGRADEAIAELRRVAESGSGEVNARYHLGLALLQTERDLEAVAELSRAIELEPRHTGARDNLALAFARIGRFDLARNQYVELGRLKPDDPLVARNRAIVEFELGRLNDAVLQTRRALELARAAGRNDLVAQIEPQLAAYLAAADSD